MFVLFAQRGVSYTPNYNFRPYYPYFQTSEICDFTWVSFRIIFFFFPSSFYHHSSFSIAERQCILKLGSYLFLILLFLDSSILPDYDLPFFFTYNCQPLSPFGLFTVSPLWKYTSVCLALPFLHSSLVFLTLCRGGSTPYSTFPWNRGERSEQKGKGSQRNLFLLCSYPESVALRTFQKCCEWDDKHPLYVASFLLFLPPTSHGIYFF